MNRIVITDNCTGKPLSELGVSADMADDLRRIANVPIGQLQKADHSALLVFPPDFETYGDDLASSAIFSIQDDVIKTGNVMGFVGVGNTSLTIRSRFTTDTSRDYFLYYMLGKVLSLNIFELSHDIERLSILDFLIFLFPVYLEEALKQGLYKKYVRREYDDMKVRGTIDVARQIKRNTPFAGKVAYNVREHSFDNPVTQLVRHTIEFIEQHPFAGGLLHRDEDIRYAVRSIRNATPSYSKGRLQDVINQNLVPFSHPYYTAYAGLQRLCLDILRHEGLMYGMDDNKVYGILFDGAWLWEEYLNKVLAPSGLKHAENKKRHGGVRLFSNGGFTVYPDFYMKRRLVLDAKYKALDKGLNAKDLHQIVCYMHILDTGTGGFIYPSQHDSGRKPIGRLRGKGGDVFRIALYIPQQATSMQDFIQRMEASESEVLSLIVPTKEVGIK